MSFWKPGTVAATNNGPSQQQLHDKILGVNAIDKYKNQLLYLIEKFQTVIVSGESMLLKGSNIPRYLMEGGWIKEGHVVACSISSSKACRHLYQAALDGCSDVVKEKVAIKVALDDFILKHVSILYTCHDQLLKAILIDPLLSKYSVIVLEGLGSSSEFVMTIIKKILRKREDLRLVILASSSENTHYFNYFNMNPSSDKANDTCIVLSLESRQYPVQDLYLSSPCKDYITEAVETVFKIHQSEGPGDILVFLTGREEIDTVVSLLSDRVQENRLLLLALPLYGGIGSEEYSVAVQPAPLKTRKIIVSTNVAEQENLLHGIVYVVDAGFVKLNVYNPKSGLVQLLKVPISKETMEARRRICGLTRPGKCFHLYTMQESESSENGLIPEIQRSNLTSFILQLKALGIENVRNLDYFQSPCPLLMKRALESLALLGLISKETGNITELGSRVVECPLNDVYLSTLLLKSASFGCTEEALIVVSMMAVDEHYCLLSGPSNRFDEAKRKFAVEEGDIVSAVNVYQSFLNSRKSMAWCNSNFVHFKHVTRAVQFRAALAKYLNKLQIPIKSCGNDVDALRKCVASVFFESVAKLAQDGKSYVFLRDKSAIGYLHYSSCLYDSHPNWILSLSRSETSKVFLLNNMTIDSIWLQDLVPEAFTVGL